MELLKSVEFYLKDGLEMAIYHLHQGRLCTLIAQVSQETDLFGVIEFYLEYGLEMADNQWYWGRFCTFTAQVFQKTECIELTWQFYSEDGFEMTIHQWYWGGLCTFIVQDSWDHRALWANRFLLRRDWNGCFWVTQGKTLHIHGSGLSRGWSLSVDGVLLGRWSWNGCLLVTLGKTLHIHCSGLLGDRALWVNMIVLFGRWSWMVIHQWHWEGDSTHSLFRSPGIQSPLNQ